ncbi:hypothetical protein AB1Y20_012240 [Prymnesium parvum]|uniref:Uncharacterized protein n=1 Tax=Prymnesium parvum TaxID=97485 RepID=A0AB34INI7_PRYPA
MAIQASQVDVERWQSMLNCSVEAVEEVVVTAAAAEEEEGVVVTDLVAMGRVEGTTEDSMAWAPLVVGMVKAEVATELGSAILASGL